MSKQRMVEPTNIRLSRSVYTKLLQVKGTLIARRGENISLDEAVEELLRVYEKTQGSGK